MQITQCVAIGTITWIWMDTVHWTERNSLQRWTSVEDTQLHKHKHKYTAHWTKDKVAHSGHIRSCTQCTLRTPPSKTALQLCTIIVLYKLPPSRLICSTNFLFFFWPRFALAAACQAVSSCCFKWATVVQMSNHSATSQHAAVVSGFWPLKTSWGRRSFIHVRLGLGPPMALHPYKHYTSCTFCKCTHMCFWQHASGGWTWYGDLVGKIMSLPMVLGMTNYEIVDRTGLAHCAPMVGHVTPFEWSDMWHHSRSLVGNITLVAFHVANMELNYWKTG